MYNLSVAQNHANMVTPGYGTMINQIDKKYIGVFADMENKYDIRDLNAFNENVKIQCASTYVEESIQIQFNILDDLKK